MKEPMHPHSEDAGQPYNRAQMARIQELRLALSATAVIAEEWQRNGGDPGPYLERIVARARDGLYAGKGDGDA